MIIEFLKKLEQDKKIGSEIIQGVSEVEIKKVETKFDIKFPRGLQGVFIFSWKICWKSSNVRHG